MLTNVNSIKAPSIYNIIIGQCVAACVLATIALGFSGVPMAISVGLGGAICVVANAIFIVKAFRHLGATASRKILKEFYLGEAFKILLSGAGFALTFIYVSVALPAFVLAGYVLVYLVGMWATIKAVSAYTQSPN